MASSGSKTQFQKGEKAKRKYLPWVDILKGLAILLVIIGHARLPGTITNIIFSFHLPAFFILAGLFVAKQASKYPFKQYVWQLVWRLLIPYLFVLLMFLPVQIVIGGFGDGVSIPTQGLNLLKIYFWGNSHYLANFQFSAFLWFFPVFFFSQIVLFAVFKYQKYYLWLITINMIFVAYLFFKYSNVYDSTQIWWGIDKVPFAFLLGVSGYGLSQIKNWINKYAVVLFSMALVIILSQPRSFSYEMLSMAAPNLFIFWFYSVVGFVGLMSLSFLLSKIKFVSKYLAYIGKHSLELLYTHAFVHYFVTPMANWGWLSTLEYNIVMITVSVFLYLVVKAVLTQISKSDPPKNFGKNHLS